MLEELSDSQYQDLVAVVDGHDPTDVQGLLALDLIEPITQTDLQNGIRYRLTAEGRRHYTLYREHMSTQEAHLE